MPKIERDKFLPPQLFTDPPVSDLFFSEYIEGASPTASNKALEIITDQLFNWFKYLLNKKLS